MSTTLETFSTDSETCPHGIEGVSNDTLNCWYCWNEEQSGSMAIDDPRRDE